MSRRGGGGRTTTRKVLETPTLLAKNPPSAGPSAIPAEKDAVIGTIVRARFKGVLRAPHQRVSNRRQTGVKPHHRQRGGVAATPTPAWLSPPPTDAATQLWTRGVSL
eukprot:9489276-Pyramimonas_sp.AAC.1